MELNWRWISPPCLRGERDIMQQTVHWKLGKPGRGVESRKQGNGLLWTKINGRNKNVHSPQAENICDFLMQNPMLNPSRPIMAHQKF